MKIKNIENYERQKLEHWSRFQLPHHLKKWFIAAFTLALLGLIGLKFIEIEPEWLKFILRQFLLFTLLAISLSKEAVEDEMISSLRIKAFYLAFIFGVFYGMVQPIANSAVGFLIGAKLGQYSLSYFQVLFFMLVIQIAFFEVLKRNR